MKDASRAWQKHFKHSVLGFSLRAPREKALFPCHWALPHTSHPTQPQQVAHKSHSLPPFGVQGLSPCLFLMGPLLLPTLKWKRCSSHSSSFLWQQCPFPPSSLRISETLSDFKSAPPTRVKEVEILFQKQRFSLGKTPWEFKDHPGAFCCCYFSPPSLYLLWSAVPSHSTAAAS